MDPRDRLRSLLDGAGCTACGASLDPGRVRVLAERGDLTFVEFRCACCGTDTLALLTIAEADRRQVDGVRRGELTPDEEARFASAPPIDEGDVRAMRTLLATHRGDLRTLLGLGGADAGRAG